MPQQVWTIGSDSSCDLVVKSNMVSGKHCRLTSDGSELTLADLDSTNGTFVNGKRLRGSRVVSITDKITLGQTQRMPWPESLEPVAINSSREPSPPSRSIEQVITLGRGPDNTVVLSESNVSTNHARLIIDGSEIVLEDLGSTNGTSIGTVENKLSRATVRPSDTIYLGSNAYQVSDLIARSQPLNITTADAKPQMSREPGVKSPAMLAAIGTVVLLLVFVGWLALRDPGSSEDLQTQNSTSAGENPASDAGPEESGDKLADSRVPVSAETETHEEPKQVGLSQQDRLLRSVFVIVCTDPQRKTPFRVGTGFAIDADHVATSAAVIKAIQDLKENGFPESFLYLPATDSELRIVSTMPHPKFEAANQIARDAQQKHDAIFDELESKPPKPEAFEAVKDQLLASRSNALQAIDQKTTYDVGIIRVDESLSHWLPAVDSDVALRPNQKLSLTGYAFDNEDPYFDRSVPSDLAALPSRVRMLVKSPDESASRVVAKTGPEQREYAYLGSPLMNPQGQVVGIYSRPTPQSGDGSSEAELTFDAALTQRIREFLARDN